MEAGSQENILIPFTEDGAEQLLRNVLAIDQTLNVLFAHNLVHKQWDLLVANCREIELRLARARAIAQALLEASKEKE